MVRCEWIIKFVYQGGGLVRQGSEFQLLNDTSYCNIQVQDGFGRKVGDLTQYAVQVVGAFIVSFYLSWKLTVYCFCTLICFYVVNLCCVQLVLFTAMPFIGLAGTFLVNATTEANNNALAQYASAGAIATETLNSIRTVTTLNMQPYVIEKYRHHLLSAMNIGIFKGFKTGAANGLLFSACFCCYALAFWYGSRLVAHDMRSGCENNCTSGGDVLACFFCVLMGGIGLGQVKTLLSFLTLSITL
jgi:ABC-type bacteriocin/lantibiotic exporter with double-glycine peptidase domain